MSSSMFNEIKITDTDISCFKSERNYKYAQPTSSGDPHGDDNKKPESTKFSKTRQGALRSQSCFRERSGDEVSALSTAIGSTAFFCELRHHDRAQGRPRRTKGESVFKHAVFVKNKLCGNRKKNFFFVKYSVWRTAPFHFSKWERSILLSKRESASFENSSKSRSISEFPHLTYYI